MTGPSAGVAIVRVLWSHVILFSVGPSKNIIDVEYLTHLMMILIIYGVIQDAQHYYSDTIGRIYF